MPRQPNDSIAGAARKAWDVKRSEDRYDQGSGSDSTLTQGRHGQDHGGLRRSSRPGAGIDPAVSDPASATNAIEGASIYPACQNLLLAARALGYGGVMTIWNLLVDAELRALLGIPDNVLVAASITLGRPVGSHGPVRRLPLDQLVYLDQWGEPAPFAIDPPGTRHTGAGPP